MLYDLATQPPEPGSVLESVFLLISIRRRETDLFRTEALLAATVGAATQDFSAVEESLAAYKHSMFPFIESQKGKRTELAKDALKQWTDHGAFNVTPLWNAGHREVKKLHSQLRRGAERTLKAEASRRGKSHQRLK